MPRLVILGGGISGLATAYYAQKFLPSFTVVLYEGSHRVGGWIQSQTVDTGSVFELGPRTLRPSGPPGLCTLSLAGELKLADQIVVAPSGQKRLIKANGKLHALPYNLKTAFVCPPFSKPPIFALFKDLFTKPEAKPDDSLYNFVKRRFGVDMANYVADPFARGTSAGDARELSVQSVAKNFFKYEQELGGVFRGILSERKKPMPNTSDVLHDPLVIKSKQERWPLWSVKGGLEQLILALYNAVSPNVEVKLNSKVERLLPSNDGRIVVKTRDLETVADHVISCIPARHLSKLVGFLHPELPILLDSIPYVTTAVVNMEFKESCIIKDPAFGYLVPSFEPSKVLGVIFDSCVFSQCNRTILTAIMGGRWFESLFGRNPSKESLLAAAVLEVQSTLGISADPFRYKVSVLEDCIPQYVLGHVERVEKARRIIKESGIKLSLAGNSYDGISVNDAVYSSKTSVLGIVS